MQRRVRALIDRLEKTAVALNLKRINRWLLWLLFLVWTSLVALKLYEDADLPGGLALLDSWGLMHALFHHSPVLLAKASGWRLYRL